MKDDELEAILKGDNSNLDIEMTFNNRAVLSPFDRRSSSVLMFEKPVSIIRSPDFDDTIKKDKKETRNSLFNIEKILSNHDTKINDTN
jgi:hypothetical protein